MRRETTKPYSMKTSTGPMSNSPTLLKAAAELEQRGFGTCILFTSADWMPDSRTCLKLATVIIHTGKVSIDYNIFSSISV
jgi:hypothetical protein